MAFKIGDSVFFQVAIEYKELWKTWNLLELHTTGNIKSDFIVIKAALAVDGHAAEGLEMH